MEESNRGQQYECQVDAGTRFIERVAAELESRRWHLWKNASPHYEPHRVRISANIWSLGGNAGVGPFYVCTQVGAGMLFLSYHTLQPQLDTS